VKLIFKILLLASIIPLADLCPPLFNALCNVLSLVVMVMLIRSGFLGAFLDSYAEDQHEKELPGMGIIRDYNNDPCSSDPYGWDPGKPYQSYLYRRDDK